MKAVLIIKYLFSVIGLGMLIGTFFLYKNTQEFLLTAVITEGTVIEMLSSYSGDSTTYKPVVEFETKDGDFIEFSSSVSSNPPAYSTGEVVEVLYQQENPQEARVNDYFSLWGAATILWILGIVFFLIGFSIILAGILKERKIKWLKERGVKIDTKFQRVSLNTFVRVNSQNPYQIYTQWKNPNTSELHVFKSENIWFDPSDHIDRETIVVLIERHNPKKYHIDLSFLPKLAR